MQFHAFASSGCSRTLCCAWNAGHQVARVHPCVRRQALPAAQGLPSAPLRRPQSALPVRTLLAGRVELTCGLSTHQRCPGNRPKWVAECATDSGRCASLAVTLLAARGRLLNLQFGPFAKTVKPTVHKVADTSAPPMDLTCALLPATHCTVYHQATPIMHPVCPLPLRPCQAHAANFARLLACLAPFLHALAQPTSTSACLHPSRSLSSSHTYHAPWLLLPLHVTLPSSLCRFAKQLACLASFLHALVLPAITPACFHPSLAGAIRPYECITASSGIS